jgi:hypothetical protein
MVYSNMWKFAEETGRVCGKNGWAISDRMFGTAAMAALRITATEFLGMPIT